MSNAHPNTHYKMKGEFLYWKDRLVLQSPNPLIQKVLLEYHSSPIGGHVGIAKTLAHISSQFYWPKMREDVTKFVQQCIIRQQTKFRPFKVVAKVGVVAYKLELPETARIHPVFHISQLKPFKGVIHEPYMPLPLTTSELGPIL
ncbi:hypothetical protein V8G54_009851 [Vigna mungo]|uniref:Integrase zinc-binding domain-containing protein n=1 Tax=Vigna mungo TaxID=3915 RepID=A0AAQ3S2I3_VIGMU